MRDAPGCGGKFLSRRDNGPARKEAGSGGGPYDERIDNVSSWALKRTLILIINNIRPARLVRLKAAIRSYVVPTAPTLSHFTHVALRVARPQLMGTHQAHLTGPIRCGARKEVTSHHFPVALDRSLHRAHRLPDEIIQGHRRRHLPYLKIRFR